MSVADDQQVSVTGLRAPSVAEGPIDWVPPVDIVETPTGFEVSAEVCGVACEDVTVSFEEGRLTVWGVRRPEGDSETHHYRERRSGRFARAFSFRTPVEESEITAGLKQGVLTLNVPKRLPRRIAVG